jgi:hypothetical protein
LVIALDERVRHVRGMNGFDHSPYLQLYIIANVAAVLFLALAIKWPRVGRWAYILLFAWAAVINASTSMRQPEVYLEYADLTFLPVYRSLILGAFSEHISLYVMTIAFCQAMIAIGLVVGSGLARVAAWGAIMFLVAIAPFGVGSGFPCTVVFAVGLFVLLRKGIAAPAWRMHRTAPTA